jgi:hypothetical protein
MYYLNGIMAVISEWIKEDCSKPIEDIIGIITGCILGFKIDSEEELLNIKITGDNESEECQ